VTDRLMLLDSASLYFRAFYGVPDTVRAPDGTPVNAVRGFLDIITRLVTTYEPTHLVACWDDDWRPQWRVDLIPTYKTHRVAEVTATGPDVEVVPDLLSPQVPVIVQALDGLTASMGDSPPSDGGTALGGEHGSAPRGDPS
jgi:5'-3' exonuclease